MIGLVAKLVGAKAAPWVTYGLIGLLLFGAYTWRINAAISEGREIEKAAWEEAIEKANAEAEAAMEAAETDGDAREIEWAEQVKEEKEKIDDAIEANTDTFDVLFPSAGVWTGSEDGPTQPQSAPT